MSEETAYLGEAETLLGVMKESASNYESSAAHILRNDCNDVRVGGGGGSHVALENNLNQARKIAVGFGPTANLGGAISHSDYSISGIGRTNAHLGIRPEIVVSGTAPTAGGKNMMHTSATSMDIKVLQKSNTFSSSLSSGIGGLKLGSWFDRKARKISMKCSKSITLGKNLKKQNIYYFLTNYKHLCRK